MFYSRCHILLSENQIQTDRIFFEGGVYEYRPLHKSALGALCKQGNAVYLFPGYEVSYLEKAVDSPGIN